MQKDFHFNTTFVLARIAGFTKEDALTIATSAQYIDDATHSGKILFSNRAGYEFYSSAHKMLDYRNFEELQNHYCWIPFHFLPGNSTTDPLLEGEDEFVQRLICQPNSEVAKFMLKRTIQKKMKPYALYQLGIAMHVYADTWAHQKFCGISHKVNRVGDILDFNDNLLEKHHYRVKKYFEKRWWEKLFSFLLTEYSPLGHGPALSLPDKPFLCWQYINFKGLKVQRDNTLIFLDACDHIFSALVNYRNGIEEFQMHKLPELDRKAIEDCFRNFTSDDANIRHHNWNKAIKEGKFSFGAEEIVYINETAKSWDSVLDFSLPREINSVVENALYSDDFLSSDWKLFHDALIDHRKTVLHEVLPSFKITVV